MWTIIFFVIAFIVLLIFNRRKKANKDLEDLLDVLNEFSDDDIIKYGHFHLGIFLPKSKKVVYDNLIKNWHSMSNDRKNLTTLHALIMKAQNDGDTNRERYLENERITLMMKMNVMNYSTPHY